MKLLAPAGEPGVTARSRLSAEHVAAAVAALCLVLFGVIHATTDVMVFSLFSIAPLVAATVADERRTAAFAGAAVALAIGAGWWDGATGECDLLDPGCGGLRHLRDGGRGGRHAPSP